MQESKSYTLIDVTEVQALDGYRISVSFEDGKRGVFDMRPYLGRGVFKALENPAYFRLVSVENGTASWPNGADMAPERLYTDCTEA